MTVIKITGEIHWMLENDRRSNLGYLWRNAAGGWHDFKESDLDQHTIYAVQEDDPEFDDYINARRVLESILHRDLSSGLIAPSGKFYGCFEGNHGNLISYALDSKEYREEITNGSWMHLRAKNWCTFSFEHFSNAQKHTLEQIGRSFDDKNYRNTNLRYDEAFPDGNPAMDFLFEKFEKISRAAEEKLQPAKLTLDKLSLYL